ncbi:hypothetical protein Gpo141_00013832 [Globisporangium polare]
MSDQSAMGFLYDIGGTLSSVSTVAGVSFATDLRLYASVCVGIQWLVALLYAVPRRDERLFDLTGSVTFASVSLLALVLAEERVWRDFLLTVMIWLWCGRLGLFLYGRIREAGEDSRFKEIRGNPLLFFSVWSVQGLWVFLTSLSVLLSLVHSTKSREVHALDIVGTALWVAGYAIEVVADHQKTQFRRNPHNKGKFIHSGLWKYSRHPNYFGEITLWIGLFFVAVHGLPSALFKGFAALSPLFVALLLTTVSGIPLLEKQSDERWGHVKAYQEYKERTSVLLLWSIKTTNKTEEKMADEPKETQ